MPGITDCKGETERERKQRKMCNTLTQIKITFTEMRQFLKFGINVNKDMKLEIRQLKEQQLQTKSSDSVNSANYNEFVGQDFIKNTLLG